MNSKFIIIFLSGAIVSFAGGFMVANSLNKRELAKIRPESGNQLSQANSAQRESDETTLLDGEIEQRISEADRNPANFEFQKNLGSALYRYAAMKSDVKLMAEAARLMTRAFENDPKDYDVLVALGNVYLDIAFASKENGKFVKSREFYAAALKERPNDVDVRTDYGLTFFLADPPQTDGAIAEFELSLKLDPKHQKTLQLMAEALIAANRGAEAGKYIDKLKAVNPENSFLPGLKSKLSAKRSAGNTR